MTNNVQGTDTAKGAVVLPCGVEDFADFIGSLLGKPQTIERHIPGSFEVDKDNISDLHQLIEQRIVSQNEGALMQFTARILYDDRSSVLVNSIDDFIAYNEVKSLVSTGVVLNWVFLLKFRGRSIPEKQVIEISFGTEKEYVLSMRVGTLAPELSPTGHSRGIKMSISHTNRTWGADIDNLIAGHLEKLVGDEHKMRTFINKNFGWLGLSAFLTTMSLCVWGLVESANRIERSLDSARMALGSTPSEQSLLLHISDAIANGAWERFNIYGGFFIGFAFIASAVVGFSMATLADTPQPSFVLLTKASEKKRKESDARLRDNWVKIILTGLLSGGAGALGKFLFERVTTLS